MTTLTRPDPNTYWVEPNRLLAGESPGRMAPEDPSERLGAWLDVGIRSFIDLTMPDELTPYAPTLENLAQQRGLRVQHWPIGIRDLGVPSVETMQRILDLLDAEIAAQRPVYVHCWGGIGRTGTVVGCHLVRHGLDGEQALDRLAELWRVVEKRWRRPHTPETAEQREFVLQWDEAERGLRGGQR